MTLSPVIHYQRQSYFFNAEVTDETEIFTLENG
jgi:hypothetical protein